MKSDVYRHTHFQPEVRVHQEQGDRTEVMVASICSRGDARCQHLPREHETSGSLMQKESSLRIEPSSSVTGTLCSQATDSAKFITERLRSFIGPFYKFNYQWV